MTHYVERQLRKTKPCFFERGIKVGILFAQQAREASVARLIPKNISPIGNLTADPAENNNIFLDFYIHFYTSEHPPGSEKKKKH